MKVAIVRERDPNGSSTICAILMDHFLVGEGDTADEAVADLRLVIDQTKAANKAAGVVDFHGLRPCPIAFQSLGIDATYTELP